MALMIGIDELCSVLEFNDRELIFQIIMERLTKHIENNAMDPKTKIKMDKILHSSFSEQALQQSPEQVIESLKQRAYFENEHVAKKYLTHIMRAEFLPQCGVNSSKITKVSKFSCLMDMVVRILLVECGLKRHSNRDYTGMKRVDAAGMIGGLLCICTYVFLIFLNHHPPRFSNLLPTAFAPPNESPNECYQV